MPPISRYPVAERQRPTQTELRQSDGGRLIKMRMDRAQRIPLRALAPVHGAQWAPPPMETEGTAPGWPSLDDYQGTVWFKGATIVACFSFATSHSRATLEFDITVPSDVDAQLRFLESNHEGTPLSVILLNPHSFQFFTLSIVSNAFVLLASSAFVGRRNALWAGAANWCNRKFRVLME